MYWSSPKRWQLQLQQNIHQQENKTQTPSSESQKAMTWSEDPRTNNQSAAGKLTADNKENGSDTEGKRVTQGGKRQNRERKVTAPARGEERENEAKKWKFQGVFSPGGGWVIWTDSCPYWLQPSPSLQRYPVAQFSQYFNIIFLRTSFVKIPIFSQIYSSKFSD